MKRSDIQNLIKIPLMTVIVILCSWITIPSPVPFTLQTFGVYCALLLLGGKGGTASLLLYIMLGAAGLPVFSGFSAGIGHLLSPLGGYIWGFLICALLYLCTEKFTKSSKAKKTAVLSLGTLLCYCAGTVWFLIFSGNQTSILTAVTLCILPFVIPDIIKILFAVFIFTKVTPIINKTIKE